MQVHARNTACEDSFFPKKRPVFRRPAEAPLAETADSWTLVPRYSVASAPYDRTKIGYLCKINA